MHYRIILSLILVLLLSAFDDGSKNKRLISPEPNFIEGEHLEFTITYGIINGGKAEMSLSKVILDGKTYYHSTIVGYTSGVVDAFFKVYDVYESWFDEKTNLPIRGIRNVREGRYRYFDDFSYFQNEGYVQSEKKGRVEVPPNSFDMACVFYYIRRIDYSLLEDGDVIYVDTYFNGKHFPFSIIYRGKEEIRTSLGRFKAIKLTPVVEPGRVFERNDAMVMWFTDDPNMIPLRVRFDAVVGSFRCDLTGFKNLKYPLSSQIN